MLQVKSNVVELGKLTPRQAEVLDLISQGKTNPEIARDLRIGYRTVRSHVDAVYKKMGVGNRTEAALIISDRKLVLAYAEVRDLREQILALLPEVNALRFYANKVAESIEKLGEIP